MNAHVAAVVPNVSVSTQTLMSQLEREPGEFIVDPWVAARTTLVAVQRNRVVAAAYLLRYAGTDDVGETYRDAGEIKWLLWWPPNPVWPDSREAADALVTAALARLAAWRVGRVYADGTLPAPGVYGVPAQWPHVHDVLSRAGFQGGRPEQVHLARVDHLPEPGRPPIEGIRAVRSLGAAGTRISAVARSPGAENAESPTEERVLGYVEVDTTLDTGLRFAGSTGLADVGNLWVEAEHRRQGVGRWLMAEARSWLELGHRTRLLGYVTPDEDRDGAEAAFLAATGFRLLTTTVRGLELGGSARRRAT